MKVQKTGPESVLLVLETAELPDGYDLKKQAVEVLKGMGISTESSPELTAYSAGGQTMVFVSAVHGQAVTYYGFSDTDALMDAALEVRRLFPEAEAGLCRQDGKLYVATTGCGPGELLREFAERVIRAEDFGDDFELLLPEKAFQILAGRC